mmetsp:Transcript_29217/g.52298  ORF Transcript_29217/g.52298 Transcript_29217/m.52298 type:complete len:122 (-) Transcript_29217:664-1029(-)
MASVHASHRLPRSFFTWSLYNSKGRQPHRLNLGFCPGEQRILFAQKKQQQQQQQHFSASFAQPMWALLPVEPLLGPLEASMNGEVVLVPVQNTEGFPEFGDAFASIPAALAPDRDQLLKCR